jgi:hypothetical protein
LGVGSVFFCGFQEWGIETWKQFGFSIDFDWRPHVHVCGTSHNRDAVERDVPCTKGRRTEVVESVFLVKLSGRGPHWKDPAGRKEMNEARFSPIQTSCAWFSVFLFPPSWEKLPPAGKEKRGRPEKKTRPAGKKNVACRKKNRPAGKRTGGSEAFARKEGEGTWSICGRPAGSAVCQL